jgi:hypothetical protein
MVYPAGVELNQCPPSLLPQGTLMKTAGGDAPVRVRIPGSALFFLGNFVRPLTSPAVAPQPAGKKLSRTTRRSVVSRRARRRPR